MKAKRLFRILTASLPIVTIGSLCATSCSLFKTFKIKVEIPEGMNLEFTNLKVEMGFNYWTYITSDKEIYDVNITIGNESLPEEAYIFSSTDEPFKYYLKIYAKYITSTKLSLKIIDKPIIDNITITFDAGEGVIQGTSEKRTTLEVENGTVWSTIQNKPLAYLEDMNFDGWSLDKQNPISPEYTFSGDETVYALYSECQHSFDSYSVKDVDLTNRRIYGHCSKCGKSIELNDEQLKEMEGQFLVKNPDGTFTLVTDRDLSFYIAEASSITEFDIYPIWGTYEINTGRPEFNRANVRLHGVNDYDGNITATLDSYNNSIVDPEAEGSIYYNLGISLYLDNMILQGRNNNIGKGWMGGIQADRLSCEYCTLLGEMATYSLANEFKHCHFDSTDLDCDPDYCIYCHTGSALIEDCSFVSDGKAIKLFNGQTPHLNEIYDCTFTIEEPLKQKAAIEVDPQFCSSENPCVIYLDNNIIDETYTKLGLDLLHINEGFPEDYVVVHHERKS